MESYFKINEDKNAFLNKDIDLMKVYDLTVQELDKQQSKRDQIIAFYISFTGIALGFLSTQSINNFINGLILLLLSLLGIILSIVIIRYRKYKEIYWITARTISTLFSFDSDEKITEEVVKNTFYTVITKIHNVKSCSNKKEMKLFLTMRKSLFSAETLLFLVTVLLTSILMFLGSGFILNYYLEYKIISLIVSIVLSVITIILLYRSYANQIVYIYQVVDLNGEKKTKRFKSIFASAWFLHFFK